MPVEERLELRIHPVEEVLEEYCSGHLKEPVLSRFEEHLLACPQCCSRVAELDDYLKVMKTGLAEIEAFPVPASVPILSSSFQTRFPSILRANALRIAAAAIFVVFGAVSWSTYGTRVGTESPNRAETQIALVALRGGSADQVPRSAAGNPLRLNIERRSLPESSAYRVEIITAEGQEAWSGPTVIAGDNLSARVPSGLGPGVYWVRLYSAPTVPGPDTPAQAQLLREFSLRLE